MWWPTHINLNYRRYEAAFTEAARALALDPNDPEASVAMAWVMITTGRPQAALDFMQTAMRLNPSYPEPLRPRPRPGAVLVRRARRGRARARGSARAQPDRDRAGAAARGDLRPSRAQAGGARHAPEMEAGREPGGAERHTRSPIRTPTDGRADGQKALDRLIDGMIIAALPLDITVPKLADALQQGGAFERAHTARTLARFGPQAAEAVPALVRCARRRQPRRARRGDRRVGEDRPEGEGGDPRARGHPGRRVEALGGRRHEGDRREVTTGERCVSKTPAAPARAP